MNIGARIKAVRRSAGLSQEELARRANMSLKGVGDIERGDIEDPHYSSLSKISEGLGVPIGALLEEPALAEKAEAPEARRRLRELDKVPSGLEELLDQEDISAPLLTMSYDEFDALYEDMSFDEALDLNKQVLAQIREVQAALNRFPDPPEGHASDEGTGIGFVLFERALAAGANLQAKQKTEDQRKKAVEIGRALVGAA